MQAIHKFISRDSEYYAKLQISRLVERVEHVSKMPGMGHAVHEHPCSGLRETHQENYRIIYCFTDEELQIVTIVHMKQQLKKRRLRSGS